jgi:glycosyltransferase involved in cell wall biosynthesis
MRRVVDVLCRSPLKDRYRLQRIGMHRDGSAAGKALAAARGLGRLTRALAARPDLAWIHATKGASLRRKSLAAALCRIFGVPYILHLHNANVEPYLCGLSGAERRWVASTLEHAARVLVLSAAWEDWLHDFAPCVVVLVPNPVDIPDLPRRREVEPGLILQVGRVGERKGSLLTLAAAADIAPEYPHLHIVYLGDGDTVELSAEVERRGMQDMVEVKGWREVEEVHRIMSRAALLALPSSAEGLPMTVLEAMARAVPVVCTPVGGLADLVVDGVNGKVAPVGDVAGLAAAFSEILADPEEGARLGAAGRAVVERDHATAIVVDRIGGVFAEVVAQVRR